MMHTQETELVHDYLWYEMKKIMPDTIDLDDLIDVMIDHLRNNQVKYNSLSRVVRYIEDMNVSEYPYITHF